jgi:hypothetical protein
METNKNSDKNQNPNEHPIQDNNTAKHLHQHQVNEDDLKYASPDKYLAMEQPGVSYTEEKNHVSNSDFLEFDNNETRSERWKAHAPNSRNSEAFNQDDYILRDNLDLDEDQSNSISADDAPDTNTTDEIL